jgi:hypothetical protein
MVKLFKLESTRNGAEKAPILATLEEMEWPVARRAVGNSSGVATQVAQEAPITAHLARIPKVVTRGPGMSSPMRKMQIAPIP